MTGRSPSEVTLLLQQARDDREDALGRLMPLVHAELRRIAGAQMRGERRDHTLDPTGLVNEAFLRLADQKGLAWQDRAQFLAVAAHAMRQVLVDHARTRGAQKRGGDRGRVTLQEHLVDETRHGDVDVLDLNEKLEAFRALHERRARVVELRFFGGLTFEEAAYVLEVSPKTVEADWYFARTWLQRELRAGREPS
jgi:RNA polymerase sigma-70 factor (ECF subfamily)